MITSTSKVWKPTTRFGKFCRRIVLAGVVVTFSGGFMAAAAERLFSSSERTETYSHQHVAKPRKGSGETRTYYLSDEQERLHAAGGNVMVCGLGLTFLFLFAGLFYEGGKVEEQDVGVGRSH